MAKVISASDWLPGFEPAATQAAVLPEVASVGAVVSNLAAMAVALEQAATEMASANAEVAANDTDERGVCDEAGSPASPVQPWRPDIVVGPAVVRLPWPTLDPQIISGTFSGVKKFNANVAAIQLLRRLEAEKRPPTDTERNCLHHYTGWGSLPGAFNLDHEDSTWVERALCLQSLLDEEAYVSCRASVNNSHYTSATVVRAIWDAVRRFGFAGGHVIEPSAGVGYFVGLMPTDMVRESHLTAVEIDQVSGRILRALYEPYGADIRIAPLEKCPLPDAWFDLAIGNVPFGDYPVSDLAHRPYARFAIHNYCIGKSIDLVRPGGLICLITSAFTMDGWDQSVRSYIASQAHLLGAIRLPSGTFDAIAGTDVQTDILFLKKRTVGETPAADWLGKTKVPQALMATREYGDLYINTYYAANPHMVIGKVDKQSRGYDKVETTVFSGGLEPALAACVAALPEGCYQPQARSQAVAKDVVPEVPDSWKQGSYRVHNARIVRYLGRELVDVHDDLNQPQRTRIVGLIAIRDCTRDLLRAQLEADGDSDGVTELRGRLNELYDRYVAKHGWLSSRANLRAMRGDPELPLLISLEHFDDEDQVATKAAIFSRNTLRRVAEPKSVATPEEALVASMAWRGRVDPQYMARLLQSESNLVMEHLEADGRVFLDPVSEVYETADEYLSGNVRKKLAQAVASGARCHRNVMALDQVVPRDLEAGLIVARLGAVWIPAIDVEAFARYLFGDDEVRIVYSADAGAWDASYNDWRFRQNVKATQEFGTARMHGMELVVDALNGQAPTVRDKDPQSDRYIVNRKETLAAREKLDTINQRFCTWIFEDAVRRERLTRLYNDLFNSTRARQFDGSYLSLPGFSGCITPYPHTLNGVARILQRGNTLIGHSVGSGKTSLAAIAAMELRRLGLARKPCHVVPNNCLMQYAAEFQRLYPTASLLILGKEDLEKSKRKEFLARVATGEWDSVIIAHSSFELIAMSPDYVKRAIGEIIVEIEMVIRAHSKERGNRIVKQLESMKKKWKARLEELAAEETKDDLITFESLGVDYVIVDEAHYYKNIFTFSKLPRIPGMPNANSMRSFDMWLKTRYMMELHGGQQRGVVFMTATFICNTVAEIHAMQRFLQPQRLEELGLQTFDAWVSTFGEVVSCLELSPEGKGYRLASRLARFNNVPELMALFTEVADIQTDDMLKLPKPAVEGGKPRVVVVPSSDRLKQYVEGLVKRAESIRRGSVPPDEDNMLSVTNDGRKAALDIRIVFPRWPAEPDSKINACVREVFQIWQETAAERSTQLVFCDFSTPKAGERKEFCVYDEIRDKLIALGIPSHEIRYVHEANTDAQKIALFRLVREGKVRVLMGTTERMGVGTNVQDRAIAAHMLTTPWRPDQMEQADGRIVRPGNRNKVVKLLRYVREGSFDSYQNQILETKARFIAQVLSGNKGIRSIEDVQMAALTYAEVKALASGNPLVIEKAAVDAEVTKLSTLFSLWQEQRWRNEAEIARMPARIESHQASIVRYEEDKARAREVSLDQFVVTLHGRQYHGGEAAGDALRKLVITTRDRAAAATNRINDIVGEFAGFPLGVVGARGMQAEANLYLQGHFAYHAAPYVQGPSLVAGLLEARYDVSKRCVEARQALAGCETRRADLEGELSRPFEHEARLTLLLTRQRELDTLLDLDKGNDGGMDQQAA